MLVPLVLAGGVHDKVIQSLKALITLGADGGPEYAEKVNDSYTSYMFCVKRILTSGIYIAKGNVNLTFCPSLNVFCLHYLTDTLRGLRSDAVTVPSPMIHISVFVMGFPRNLSNLLPGVASHLITFKDIVNDWAAPIIFWWAPFELNAV